MMSPAFTQRSALSLSQLALRCLLALPLTMTCACRSPLQFVADDTKLDRVSAAQYNHSAPIELPANEGLAAEAAQTPLPRPVAPPFAHHAAGPAVPEASTYACGCQHGTDEGPCFSSSGCGDDGESPEWPADEWLCDGGDQETTVTLNRQRELRGLDPEDTVAHFDTTDGRTLIKPSNSVCIYAPRFAAVRKIVQTAEDERLDTMAAIEQPLPALTDFAPQPPQLVEQPLPPLQVAGLKGPLALRERTGGVELLQAQRVAELVQDFAAYADLQVIRLGIHQRSQRALLEESAEAALVWTDYLSPEVMLENEPAEVDVTVEKPSTIHHLDERGTPCLRVIKLASTGSARPGEEVEFTLRFDNTGDQPIKNVTLVDRLTTRLEYVPDSAQSSLKARFSTAPHETESLVLRWEIEETIQPGQGGILRFRCKVR